MGGAFLFSHSGFERMQAGFDEFAGSEFGRTQCARRARGHGGPEAIPLGTPLLTTIQQASPVRVGLVVFRGIHNVNFEPLCSTD